MANSIDYHLGGSGIYFGRPIDVPESRLDPRIWDIPRAEAAKLTVEKRKNSFAEVESTFTLDQAMSEVYRCMRCDRNSVQQLHLRTFPAQSLVMPRSS